MRDLKIPDQRHPEKGASARPMPSPKKPSWIRVKGPGGQGGYQETTHRIHARSTSW